MTRCVTCGKREIASDGWTWQPFGPDDKIAAFTTPGYHYRGFPALHVCDDCKRAIQNGETVVFRHKRGLYRASNQMMESL